MYKLNMLGMWIYVNIRVRTNIQMKLEKAFGCGRRTFWYCCR